MQVDSSGGPDGQGNMAAAAAPAAADGQGSAQPQPQPAGVGGAVGVSSSMPARALPSAPPTGPAMHNSLGAGGGSAGATNSAAAAGAGVDAVQMCVHVQALVYAVMAHIVAQQQQQGPGAVRAGYDLCRVKAHFLETYGCVEQQGEVGRARCGMCRRQWPGTRLITPPRTPTPHRSHVPRRYEIDNRALGFVKVKDMIK
jgi:hypothetical protein